MKHKFSAGDMASIISVSRPSIANWVSTNKLKCNEVDEETGKYHFTIKDVRYNSQFNNRPGTITTTFGNIKGGVGKTTIVVNLAAAAAEFGFKVLIVDADKQGNSTDFYLDKKPSPNESTILKIFLDENTGREVIRKTNHENLDIIPCNLKFGEINQNRDFETFFKLKHFLNKYKSDYHFVFIDTPPDISLPTEAAIIAADYVIGVTDPDIWGLEGLQNLRNKAIGIKSTHNSNLKIAGFIFNKVFEFRRLDRDVLEHAKESLDGIPRIKTKVPLIQGYKEAIHEKKTIFEKGLEEKYEDVIIDLAVEVLGVLA